LIYPPKSDVTDPSEDSDYEPTPALFLPAVGDRDYEGNLNLGSSFGYYWSSTAASYSGMVNSYILVFRNSAVQMDLDLRASGLSVRCVAD
jgi:hypothetical protein